MTYRQELIQVAAVAVAALHDLDYGATAEERLPGLNEAWAARTKRILDLVRTERLRQETKFGPQHHSEWEWMAILMEEVGEAAKETLLR